ncbi:MAG: hypothetical protein AAF360_05715 [Pseudomonadota bacterium]
MISISEAASTLGLNKSTLSRFVAANPHLVKATRGAQKLVDLDEVKAARESLDPALQTRGPAAGDAPQAASPQADTPTPPRPNAYQQARTADVATRARLKQIDLDERQGRLMPTDDAAQMVEALSFLLRDRLRALAHDASAPLARETEPEAVRAYLEAQIDEILTDGRRIAADALAALRPAANERPA